MQRGFPIAAVTMLLVFRASLSPAAVLVHQYELNGNSNDALGLAPSASLTTHGGSFTATEYLFGLNQGLELTNGFSHLGGFPDDYSVVMDFRITRNDGYRKLIDFKNGTTDYGLYNYFGQLRFYNSLGFGIGNAVPADTQFQLTLTRDGASDIVKAYLGTTLQFSFLDSSNHAVFSTLSNTARFLEDDDQGSRNETSAGSITRLLIYQGALTQAEIPPPTTVTAYTVPEPATLAIWGMAAICGLLRRARIWRRAAVGTRMNLNIN